MNQNKQLALLTKEAAAKLVAIRAAMKTENRQLAIQLAAERYQLLQQITILSQSENAPKHFPQPYSMLNL
jgi:hypothetical protein